MTVSENKTRPTGEDARKFLEKVENMQRKQDSYTILEMMENLTGTKPVMWGTSIIGFGTCHYKYASGREGDMLRVGFSPRKQNLVFYIHGALTEYKPLLGKLGKHKTGKSCLYINKLDDVDLNILKEIIRTSFNKSG